jgi:hypothetical protein
MNPDTGKKTLLVSKSKSCTFVHVDAGGETLCSVVCEAWDCCERKPCSGANDGLCCGKETLHSFPPEGIYLKGAVRFSSSRFISRGNKLLLAK